jgi:hypothetical protein
MTRHVPAFAAFLTLLVAAAWPAGAQGQPARTCAERAALVERLKKGLGEVRQAMGLNRANAIVEVFASAETGTWTILVTTPNGISCLVANGDLWESQNGPLRRRESDA